MTEEKKELTRRTFLKAAAAAVGLAGLGASAIPFIRAMSPSKDVLATGTIKVDISDLSEGQFKSVIWRKQPLFILKRSKQMIELTDRTDPSSLADPASPKERAIRPGLFVSLGICTHLGCIPNYMDRIPGQGTPGFYCPCHGGEYDTLGRRLSGPPPENLHLVPYRIIDDQIEVGTEAFSGYNENIRKIEKLPKI